MRRADTTGHGQGFTLVEVLIAIAVVGIMFASLAALQISNFRVTASAERSTSLLEEAVAVFESVKIDVESNFSTYNACDECTLDWPGADVVISGAPSFGESAAQDGLVEVRVRVEGESGEVLEFRQIISCVDAAVPPTVANPGECVL